MFLHEFYGALPYPKGLSKTKLAKVETDRIWYDLVMEKMNLALSTAIEKWGDSLPDSCNARYLEMNFLLRGQACLQEKDGAYLSLGCGMGGDINLYREPTNGYAYGANGYNESLTFYIDGAEESDEVTKGPGLIPQKRSYNAVFGRDNTMMYPYINYIIDYCKRMVDVQRACDVMIQNLKQPVIIQCSDDQFEAVKRALNQKDDNVAAIISTGRTLESIQNFHVWPTNVNASNLQEMKAYYEWIESQLDQLLGINANPQPDKAERLIVDEVNSNNDRIAKLARIRDLEHKKFSYRINKAFGLNTHYDIDDDIDVSRETLYNEDVEDITDDDIKRFD